MAAWRQHQPVFIAVVAANAVALYLEFREEARQSADLVPALAGHDGLHAEIEEIVVQHGSSFLRQRRVAVVLLLPNRHAIAALE
jgi:hypothetical protein